MVFTKSTFSLFLPPWHIFWSLFTSFRPQGPHLASLGPLLAPSGAPFGPPWDHFGASWPPFGSALAPLEANFGHLGLPRHLLGRFLTEFHGFSMNSVKNVWHFLNLFIFLFQNLLQFSLLFPIPASISNASMPQSTRAT